MEEIKGTANYVEWQVLKQLDDKKADALTGHMRTVMTRPDYLFPIRISCYYTGALMIHALRLAGLYTFSAPKRPVLFPILENTSPSDGTFPGKEACLAETAETIAAFHQETKSIIRAALEKNRGVLNGPAELESVNIYDARCYKGFITSTYFLMVRENNESRMLEGYFVIRMQDEKTIAAVYRWEPDTRA